MKKLKRLIGALSMLAVLVVVLTACGSRQSLSKQDVLTNDKASKTITWGVKADTKLFGLMDVKDNTIKGFDADIARALTKRVLGKDATAKFVQVTSQTRIPLLKNGNIDAIIATMTITPEREKQVDFTDSYFDAGQSLLVKKGSSIKSVKDLNKTGTKVLGVTGANSVENIKKVAPKAKVLELSDYAQAMTALKSGQGVALTTDNGILYGMAAQNPGYEVVGGTFTKEPYGIAVNKGQTPLKKELNKALKEIEADGTYNRILKKWFGNVAGFDYKEASR
ncbi:MULTISPECIES: transporter substrate-binding domain-containing protein [Lactiplantibacillus]|jgi:putative glutamine transport system substrate-binding protein|uniref:Glutamine ABC transporter substrate-binding protein n=4 Tax=Lactiplantibacillus pentosus TaxID=1589 RepID=A0A241RN35_LACPE|nr:MULTISPECIES: transporter substrate-binding domain-containing protein [Lactiplantibacillus]MCH4130013.1 transporter substrate-binding domain-containing protein [Lactiplantibacillus sp.]CCC16317.1 glutamine ABC transporter, substrate binding protein [Lactiplantibacillus pentosus IG1]BBM20883.1 glutamine ABC transporter, substrate binding protein [Lactiplantibacillus plantarum]ASG79098.1 glutamine ABC transporter substrate-binding protein [Lactiplantibacillus pentosus]AUI79476.1 glutamine ABC